MKLAALVTHPIQYFAPVFRSLAKNQSLQLKVFYGCPHGVVTSRDPDFGVAFQWDCAPTEGYDYCFVANGSIDSLRGLSGYKLGGIAAQMIDEFSPDAVLVFSYSPTFISTATIKLSRAGYRLMLRAETTDVAQHRSLLRGVLRDFCLRRYYRQFSCFFPIGTRSKEHYLRLGVPESSMATVLYAVDTLFFQDQIKQWAPKRKQLRADAGIAPADKVIMFCGKMSPAKDPLLIAQALELLPVEEKSRLWLIAVGDGVLRNDFETKAKKELGDRIKFTGFRNQSRLGEYYVMSDIFVLPSTGGETWGLVVNEAIQFGLRAIVSDRVGCGPDLLGSPELGSIFPAGDSKALADAISRAALASNPKVQIKIPKPEDLADAVCAALLATTSASNKSYNLNGASEIKEL